MTELYPPCILNIVDTFGAVYGMQGSLETLDYSHYRQQGETEHRDNHQALLLYQ